MKKSIITVLCIFVFVATAFADSNLSSFCASDSTEYYKSLYKLYLNTNLQLQTDTREKSQIINNLRDELNSLRIELDSLHAFKQEYVKIKIKEAERYLVLSFREMDCDSLHNIITLFDKLDEEDATIKELKYKYERKLKQKHRYDSWFNLLGSDLVSYDDIKQMADSVRQEVDKNDYSDLQQTEMDSVLFAMEHYEDAIKSFKFVIEDITYSLNDYIDIIHREPENEAGKESLKEYCREDIKRYFLTNSFKAYEKEIFCVPYLKDQFYEYKRAVLQNPLEHENLEIEEKIINYKIDGVYE